MPSLICREKFNCEESGTQTAKFNFARHVKSCSAGTLFCTQCSFFSTKSQKDFNYHIAKKDSAAKPVVAFKIKLCYQDFPGLYALSQHKNTQYGFRIKTVSVDPDDIIDEVNDASLKEELRSCQHFLVDFKLKDARDKVFIYAIANLSAKFCEQKL